jgi:hypothetical protein
MSIHWLRVIGGALLLELVLLVTLVPIGFLGENAFLTAVPIGCFVFGYLVTLWILRKVMSGFVLNGVLIGVVATTIYIGFILVQPNGWSTVVAMYGAPLFYSSNALRIAGCAAAGAHLQRLASAASRQIQRV